MGVIRAALFPICVFALSLFTTSTAAQTSQNIASKPEKVSFHAPTGEKLVESCKETNTASDKDTEAKCLMYFVGFDDGYSAAMVAVNSGKQARFCEPQSVTPQQEIKVVLKYGADHPEKLWMPAGVFVAVALREAYPCKQ